MSERVVDALEIVEIDEKQSDAAAVPRGARQCVTGLFLELHAVGELGQRIEARLTLEPRGQQLFAANIVKRVPGRDREPEQGNGDDERKRLARLSGRNGLDEIDRYIHLDRAEQLMLFPLFTARDVRVGTHRYRFRPHLVVVVAIHARCARRRVSTQVA